MQLVLKITVIAIFISSVASCSNFRFPGAYKLKIQQGNYIEQEKVDQLKIGMTKRQVQFIMGTPMVQDTFNPDRWDYFFSIKQGNELLKDYRLTTFFENDLLVRWDGDYEPAQKANKEEQEEAIESARKKDEQKF